MYKFIYFIFISLISQNLFSCMQTKQMTKNTDSVMANENRSANITQNKWCIDSILFYALKKNIHDTKSEELLSPNPKKFNYLSLYDKIWGEMPNKLQIEINHDTLFIVDYWSIVGGILYSFCWNKDGVYRRFETSIWNKNVKLQKKDSIIVRLISLWDLKTIQELDSITKYHRDRNDFRVHDDGGNYRATRIIFKKDTTIVNCIRFDKWYPYCKTYMKLWGLPDSVIEKNLHRRSTLFMPNC